MAIFLDQNSKVIVQGMTGAEGKKHSERMIKSGTQIVAGVTPGKGGQTLEVAGKNGTTKQLSLHNFLILSKNTLP